VEFVIVYEVLYFRVILLSREYNYGISFICSCYQSIIFFKFFFRDWLCSLEFRVGGL